MQAQTESLEHPLPTPKEILTKAKIELFLDRATEEYASGRYRTAQATLEQVRLLDAFNEEADRLEKQIQERLQAVCVAQVEMGQKSQGGDGAPHSEVVLIVDQDSRVLTGLSGTFRAYGLSPVGAGSYEEALATLEYCSPQVVVSEINFDSGSRGFELLETVRARNPERNTVFLFVAARADRNIEVVGYRLGVDGFFTKPLDYEVVAATVLRRLSVGKQAG